MQIWESERPGPCNLEAHAPSPVGVARPTPPNGTSTFRTPQCGWRGANHCTRGRARSPPDCTTPAPYSGWGWLITSCPLFHPPPENRKLGNATLARRGATSFCFLPLSGKNVVKKQHLFGTENAFEAEGGFAGWRRPAKLVILHG